MDHINFFLQEVEKSRRQIPESTCVDGYMKFALHQLYDASLFVSTTLN